MLCDVGCRQIAIDCSLWNVFELGRGGGGEWVGLNGRFRSVPTLNGYPEDAKSENLRRACQWYNSQGQIPRGCEVVGQRVQPNTRGGGAAIGRNWTQFFCITGHVLQCQTRVYDHV